MTSAATASEMVAGMRDDHQVEDALAVAEADAEVADRGAG